jgi:hypothetical protein
MNDEERLKAGCWQMVVFIAAVAISMIVCSFFTSCKSVEYVPVIEHKTDTLIKTNLQHDSIYVRDSIMVSQQGDTVRIEKWHTKYVERDVHDTTYISKTDSIPKPYPVIQEVPAKLTWWQQTRLHIANILLWALLIVGIGLIIKKKLLP